MTSKSTASKSKSKIPLKQVLSDKQQIERTIELHKILIYYLRNVCNYDNWIYPEQELNKLLSRLKSNHSFNRKQRVIKEMIESASTHYNGCYMLDQLSNP
jgi:hypothetical protein